MNRKRLLLTFDDLYKGILTWRIWLTLGWQDIRLRYRRSSLGPIWITISTAIMIYSMGFLYSHLFNIELANYYPFLASGIILWTFISTTILETSDSFMEAQHFIKQIKLPYSVYILRILARNFIIFLHNIIALIPILIYFHFVPNFFQILQICLGLIAILSCGFIYGMILAIIGTRFRDIKQIINSLVQIFFLLTPIMWQSRMLPPTYQFIIELNPFNHLIELFRAPILGTSPSTISIAYALALIACGALLLILLLWRCRHRIAFWI